MKKNNSGFTIIEFVCVMAIMAIAVSVLVVNIGVLSKYRARECSSKITTCITELRVDTLSKAKYNGNMFMVIKQGDDHKYYANTYLDTDIVNPIKSVYLGGKNTTINYIFTNPTTHVKSGGSVTSSHVIYIAFSRTSGEMLDSGGNTSQLTSLYISARDRSYETIFVPRTGKVISKMNMY